ncbi:MAG: hypothetical protein N2596_07060, partial [Syntrophorhabdaceae bacterium]|nr:hypothetical protein [Syntrophorhabdaceae bacterium]
IPERYNILLEICRRHYGLFKKTEELLKELNHPYVNWEYCLKTLKTISIGDFYTFNNHEKGAHAIEAILNIYLEIIKSCSNENIKEAASRYLFEYLHVLITKSGIYKDRNIKFLNYAIEAIYKITLSEKGVFKKTSGGLKVFLKALIEEGICISTPYLKKLASEIFSETYEYWITQPDPILWNFGDHDLNDEEIAHIKQILFPLSHDYMKALLKKIKLIERDGEGDFFDLISKYIELPDHGLIVDGYFLAADNIERLDILKDKAKTLKLGFLYNMMNIQALSDVYMNILLEINRSLGRVFKEIDKKDMEGFVKAFFNMLKKGPSYRDQKGPIIDCITTIGREVFLQNNHNLVNTFIDELISFGFQYPEIRGSTSEWQVVVNPGHVMNIRAWLNIIATKPRWTKRLISALIINLKLGGIFIKDTDLIQKDISNLLNSDITPAYNLVKQLLRMFPVFFSEIGAEGELRAISTDVDEMTHRNDKLINFLRKQSHVESNSLLVNFIEEIFKFWSTGIKDGLKQFLPEEIYNQIKNEGEYFDGMHKIFKWVMSSVNNNLEQLLTWERDDMEKKFKKIRG